LLAASENRLSIEFAFGYSTILCLKQQDPDVQMRMFPAQAENYLLVLLIQNLSPELNSNNKSFAQLFVVERKEQSSISYTPTNCLLD